MKLNLTISDDAELRKAVKRMIQNAVNSSAKDEIRKAILDAIGDGTKELTLPKINTIIKHEIEMRLDTVTKETYYDREYQKLQKLVRVVVQDEVSKQRSYIKDQIRKQVKTAIGEITPEELDEIISKKVKTLLAGLLGETVRKI